MRTQDFFSYDAGRLAIDPARPFQVCTKPLPAVVAQKATQEEADATLVALQAAKDNGTLPCNLKQWEHYDRYIA